MRAVRLERENGGMQWEIRVGLDRASEAMSRKSYKLDFLEYHFIPSRTVIIFKNSIKF